MGGFSKDWKEMLPYGVLNKRGNFHFHMVEMNLNPERRERVRAFYRVIEQHALMLISCKINISDLERAKRRIHVPSLTIDWGAVGQSLHGRI